MDNTQKPRDDQELLYKALGAILLIKDRFSDELGDLFDKANASKEELEKDLDEVTAGAQQEKKRMEESMKKKIREVIDEMGLATKEDIAELKEMIKALSSQQHR